jgi:hypothetical protein
MITKQQAGTDTHWRSLLQRWRTVRLGSRR